MVSEREHSDCRANLAPGKARRGDAGLAESIPARGGAPESRSAADGPLGALGWAGMGAEGPQPAQPSVGWRCLESATSAQSRSGEGASQPATPPCEHFRIFARVSVRRTSASKYITQ